MTGSPFFFNHFWDDLVDVVDVAAAYDSVRQVVFHVTPNFLYWIKIRGFGRSVPPVYAIVIKEFLSFMAGVLGIIVLLKSMVVWILGLYEW